MKSKILISLLVFVCILHCESGIGQNNFFVGLSTSRALAKNNNAILNSYNDNSDFEQPFGDLNWLYGLTLGVRKKIGVTGLSFSWTNVQSKKDAFKEDPIGVLSSEDLRYSFNTYEIGLETHIKAFSYGFSIGRRSASIKSRIGSSDQNKSIVGESGWTSRFHIALTNTGSDYNSISIRPYFEYAWNDTDITDLSTLLLGNGPIKKSRFHMYGISIIFYNGRQ